MNQTCNSKEKEEVRKKLLFAQTTTVRRLWCIKKGRTNAEWENVITNIVPESEVPSSTQARCVSLIVIFFFGSIFDSTLNFLLLFT